MPDATALPHDPNTASHTAVPTPTTRTSGKTHRNGRACLVRRMHALAVVDDGLGQSGIPDALTPSGGAGNRYSVVAV